jgi:RNA polymerase sigma-70 factor (ECF subfamily)
VSHLSGFHDLMARLDAGDADAAGEVFRRFAGRLVGLARCKLGGRLRAKVDPEDVLQSVYKSFFRRHAGGELELTSWDGLWGLLTVITVRKCSRWAERFRTGRRDLDREVTAAADGPDAGWDALAREPTPVEAALLAETVERLLAGLDAKERAIVTLALQGADPAEIGAAVGRTRRTVNRVLRRVRQDLERLAHEPG